MSETIRFRALIPNLSSEALPLNPSPTGRGGSARTDESTPPSPPGRGTEGEGGISNQARPARGTEGKGGTGNQVILRHETEAKQRPEPNAKADFSAPPQALTPNPSPTGRGEFSTVQNISHPSPPGRGTEGEGQISNQTNPASKTDGEGSISNQHQPGGTESSYASLAAEPGDIDYRADRSFSSLLEQARELRQNQTPAEELLWQHLRNRHLMGAKFRRQHQFGSYILDFYCHEARLAVECDGSVHTDPEQKEYDLDRDANLRAEGLTVLRFWNREIENEIDRVLGEIARHLPEALTPNPSPPGRGTEGEGWISNQARPARGTEGEGGNGNQANPGGRVSFKERGSRHE